jgi:hypothetical protein
MRFLLALLVLVQDPPRIAQFVRPSPDPAHVFVLDSAHILSAAAIAALQDSARALIANQRPQSVAERRGARAIAFVTVVVISALAISVIVLLVYVIVHRSARVSRRKR